MRAALVGQRGIDRSDLAAARILGDGHTERARQELLAEAHAEHRLVRRRAQHVRAGLAHPRLAVVVGHGERRAGHEHAVEEPRIRKRRALKHGKRLELDIRSERVGEPVDIVARAISERGRRSSGLEHEDAEAHAPNVTAT